MSRPGQKSPPPPPSSPSEYDGYEHYRERFEPKPFMDWLQGKLAVTLFFVVWFGVGAISSRLLIGNSKRAADIFLLGAFGWVIVGFGSAIAYLVVISLERVRSQPALWFALLAFGGLIGFIGLRYW
jgi:hypothetical protein